MYIRRLLEEQLEQSLKSKKVLFLLGARQVGKTTLIEHLLEKTEGKLLNMDIDLDHARLKAASKLSPQDALSSLSDSDLLIIDEAQRVPDIGRIVKGWYDARVPVKIILLGSSSAMLLDQASAELTGRNEKIWLTPLLFKEVLARQDWYSDKFSIDFIKENFAEQINAILLERLVYGSYPESVLTSDPRQYLTNLTSDYLLKDIFTNSIVRSPDDVRRLLAELARSLGDCVAISQLATRLKLSRQTVQRYLDLLEGIFVIFSLPAYCTDPIKEVKKSRKYYFWDTGVKNSIQREWVVSQTRSDMDVLWENWVMAEVYKQGKTFNRLEDMFFWQSRNGSSVDLVVKQGSQIHPFDFRFYPHLAKPSRSFKNTYSVLPKTITPENFLEVLL